MDKQRAQILVKDTIKAIETKREKCKESFKEIYDTVDKILQELEIDITIPRLCKRQQNRANVSTLNPEDYYTITIFIPILDEVLEDLNYRFEDDIFNPFCFNICIPNIILSAKNLRLPINTVTQYF